MTPSTAVIDSANWDLAAPLVTTDGSAVTLHLVAVESD